MNTIQTAQLFEPIPSSRRPKSQKITPSYFSSKSVEGKNLAPTESSFQTQQFRPFDNKTLTKLKSFPRIFRSSKDRIKIPSYSNFDKKNFAKIRQKQGVSEKRRGRRVTEKCCFSSSQESSQENLMDRGP